MSTHKHQQTGFTIVELLIVIFVLGILAALIFNAYNGIQEKGRDTERQTDIRALRSHMEAYWAQKGYYPSLTDMNDQSAGGFVATNMQGLALGAFKDPRGASNALVATPTTFAYAYAVTDSSGASCEADDTTCSNFTLTATLEGSINGSSTYAQKSLNN